MSRTPRVLYALPRLELGGSERHIIGLAQALVASGGEALIVCLYEAGSLAAEARAGGAEVRALGLRGVADPRAVPLLAATVLRFSPDVVQACLFGFDALVAWPARWLRVPLVLSTRRELAPWMRSRHLLLCAAGNFAADLVVCCSEAVRRRVLEREGLAPGRVITLRNGVDAVRFSVARERREEARQLWGLAAQDLAITTVANFDHEKGHRVFLEAVPRVISALPSARFLWAGDGPLHAELVARVAAAGLEGRVVLPGRVDDVPGLLAASDMFVLPSLAEGLPNALLEAMAAGLPAVATRVGGCPEVVVDGVNGLLVPPADAAALAAAVCRLGQDTGLAQACAAAALAGVADWRRDLSDARYLKLYRRAMEGRLT